MNITAPLLHHCLGFRGGRASKDCTQGRVALLQHIFTQVKLSSHPKGEKVFGKKISQVLNY